MFTIYRRTRRPFGQAPPDQFLNEDAVRALFAFYFHDPDWHMGWLHYHTNRHDYFSSVIGDFEKWAEVHP